MSDFRFEIVERTEAHTGDPIPCLHVMIDSNSLEEIADTHIPLDDIQAAIKRYNAALRAEGAAQRRSQGAKDGWEIRRGKKAETKQ